MAKDIKLKSFTVNDFGGISKENPIVLYVGDAYANGKNIAIAKGDQGTGKTSWLTAIQGLFASSFDIKEQNFINNGNLNAGFEFEFKGNEYKVTWTKSQFKLQKKELNELTDKVVWREELSPVATLKNIIGYIGTSPMALKSKDGAKQVEEIRKALSVAPEIQQQEKQLFATFNVAKESRTSANREYDRLRKALDANPLYLNWEESELKFAEQKNSETEKKKIQDLEARKTQYKLAEQEMSSLRLKETNLSEEIEEMEMRIQQKKIELMQVNERINKDSVFIEENKGIVQEYANAQELYLNIERYLAEQREWQDVIARKKEMDEYQELVIGFDAKKDELKKQLLEIGKKGLPDINGLEVVTSADIDGREVGVYLNGKNAYQLSESELWGLFLEIWGTQNVNYVFVENISSLGSHAIDILNDLAAKNVKIFASLMARGTSFSIELTDKITND